MTDASIYGELIATADNPHAQLRRLQSDTYQIYARFENVPEHIIEDYDWHFHHWFDDRQLLNTELFKRGWVPTSRVSGEQNARDVMNNLDAEAAAMRWLDEYTEALIALNTRNPNK